jgi:ligand-binding sensor domain-containing protein
MASNKVHRSFNQGDSFKEISGDLTKGGKKGDVPFGTISCIHESPLTFGLIYAGTDDGLVHLTMDGGSTWNRIDQLLPQNLWVSSIQASAFKASRVYVTLNGYRNDHFKPYVYVSEDYGKTWNKIGEGLPNEPVNVLKEDPANENLIYIGTDNGLYCS